MELPFDKTTISYKMPITTRSTTRSFHTAADAIANEPVVVAPPNNNKKWSSKEMRTLLRMCRQTNMTPYTMAAALGRSEDAIRYRMSMVIHEHMDGRTDEAAIKEATNWLIPN
jgi:hypothetical protein